MHERLIANIRKKVPITEEEFEQVKPFFIPKKIRKRQFILNAGDVSQHTMYVENGLLREFSVDDDGHEHVVQFAPEDWWITDMGSFLSGDPAVYNIEALEDSELLLLTKKAMDEMLDLQPKMERYFRLLMQNSLVVMQRRIVGALSLSAEEKYKRMIKLDPNILQRATQQHIASFLGITPETLSRVLKLVSERK